MTISDQFADDVTPHKKKSKKKAPPKSKHKHNYEVIELEKSTSNRWFTHQHVCTICGKSYNEIRLSTMLIP